MRSSASLATALLFPVYWAFAQSPIPAADRKPETPASAAKVSFFIVAEFSEGINARKLKPGDKIKAQVTQDVLSHGKIVIPVDTQLVGHVTEAKRRTADDQESRLGIVFDKVVLKHHVELDFHGVIQSLEAPAPRRSKIDEPDQMMPPSSMGVSQGSSMTPMGGGPSRGPATGSNPSMISGMPSGAPVYMDGTPGSNAGNSAGGDLHHPSGGRPAIVASAATPLGAGMPLGVYGIKGLNLEPGPTSETPGPVITSTTREIKLEYGTQVLVKATDPHVLKP